MAELVDAPGLGPGAFGREGSSPFSRTNQLLSKPSPVETGWVAVPDVEQRSPTRVGVVRVVGLVGSSSAVGGESPRVLMETGMTRRAHQFHSPRSDSVTDCKERRDNPPVTSGCWPTVPGSLSRLGGGKAIGPIPPRPSRVGSLEAAHGIEDLIVVADARMLSAANLAALDEARLRFIVRGPHHASPRRP